MDYASFRRWRDELVSRRPGLLRLDCMNAERALGAWALSWRRSPVDAPASPERALAAWMCATGWTVPPETLVVGTGVRDLLAAVLAAVARPTDETWLPGDVYPVYADLARRAGLSPRTFWTLPEPDWSFLSDAGPHALVVLPLPLSPRGRWPSEDERAALVEWLATSGGRRLVVDAAYTYDFATSRAHLAPLVETGRTAVLGSCAKSWLAPATLGVGCVPPAWAAPMRAHLTPPAVAVVTEILERDPAMPRRLQAAFDREWRRVAPALQAAEPTWQPPSTGYFAVVRTPQEQLLDRHAILAVPASVFGSTRADLTVVTCLHDLAAHEQGG